MIDVWFYDPCCLNIINWTGILESSEKSIWKLNRRVKARLRESEGSNGREDLNVKVQNSWLRFNHLKAQYWLSIAWILMRKRL